MGEKTILLRPATNQCKYNAPNLITNKKGMSIINYVSNIMTLSQISGEYTSPTNTFSYQKATSFNWNPSYE
jgi:hypothetical protein